MIEELDITTVRQNMRSLVKDQQPPNYKYCDRCWIAIGIPIRMETGAFKTLVPRSFNLKLYCTPCFEKDQTDRWR